jgi:hypothetical protein
MPRMRAVPTTSIKSFHDEFWVSPQVPTLVAPFVATASTVVISDAEGEAVGNYVNQNFM